MCTGISDSLAYAFNNDYLKVKMNGDMFFWGLNVVKEAFAYECILYLCNR